MTKKGKVMTKESMHMRVIDENKKKSTHQLPVGADRPVVLQYLPGVQLANIDRPVVALNAPAGDTICAPTAGGQ